MLRNKGRPYLFSNSIAPAVAGASIEVFNMLEESTELLDSLRANTAQFRQGLKQAGFTIAGHDDCPIAPVMIGDARKAAQMADELMKYDIYVIGFSYPVVPMDKARIRTQLSAAHTPAQIDKTIAAFTTVGKQMGVI